MDITKNIVKGFLIINMFASVIMYVIILLTENNISHILLYTGVMATEFVFVFTILNKKNYDKNDNENDET